MSYLCAPNYAATFDYEMSLVRPVMAATRRGVLIDTSVFSSIKSQLEVEIENLQNYIDAAAGHSVNVKSPPQVQALVYGQLGLPIKRNKKSGNATADKDALNELGAKHGNPVLHAILKIRERRDYIERYLNVRLDGDSRMRCAYDITGTRTFRLSSRASLSGSGTNLQNIPNRKKIGEQIKRGFVADPGKIFVGRDYSQAEVWLVAYIAECRGLIELLNDPTRDIHRENAAKIFAKLLEEITDLERYLAKRTVHSSNYGVGGDNLSTKINEEAETTGIRITAKKGDELIQRYFMIYPEIKENYWADVDREMAATRTLVNPFGGARTFFGRNDYKLKNEAYAQIPQSTVGMMGSMAFANCYNNIELGRPKWGAELLLNVHDFVMMQVDIEYAEDCAKEMERQMEIPLTVKDKTFVIPSDCKTGFNWGKAGDDNPRGMHDVGKYGFGWIANAT